MNSGVPEGLAVPALLMTPVVLLLICTIYINTYIYVYYEFSLLHIFSLVLQPWMSAYIRKTGGVYMYVFGLPHLGPKKQ
jgi:hypothetical protein